MEHAKKGLFQTLLEKLREKNFFKKKLKVAGIK